jgi:hypothetical protein
LKIRRILLALVVVFIGLGAACLTIRFVAAAPTNGEVALRFNRARSIYEQLRDMLAEDSSIEKIASWGVMTTTAFSAQMPPVPETSLDRYQKYVALLSGIGARGMLRGEGAYPEVCVLMWASGWAADTVHVSVCWLGRDAPPPRPGATRSYSRFQLDGRWYIERDDG